MMTAALAGKHILVAEGESLAASDLKQLLEGADAIVVGPVANFESGMALADRERIDAAILDVDLEGACSYPIVDRLMSRDIPVMLITRYDRWSLPASYRHVPRVARPFDDRQVVSALDRMCAVRAKARLAVRAGGAGEPAVARIAALATLDRSAREALAQAVHRRTTVPATRELIVEGQEIRRPQLVLSGWAARVRELADGRRQIVSFLLPGDIIGLCDQPRPVASSTIVAVTSMVVCSLPRRGISPALDKAYAISRALDEAYLLAQVTRLGQLNAYERLADFLLELLERLQLAGLAPNASFTLPITQEMMADTLGLTSVHINRTLQTMRRENGITLKNRVLTFPDPEAMARSLSRTRVRVVAGRT